MSPAEFALWEAVLDNACKIADKDGQSRRDEISRLVAMLEGSKRES